jgi:hypothetical protein
LICSFVLALSSQFPWWSDAANMVYIVPQVTRVKLKSLLWKYYGHHDLVNRYGISVLQTPTDLS